MLGNLFAQPLYMSSKEFQTQEKNSTECKLSQFSTSSKNDHPPKLHHAGWDAPAFRNIVKSSFSINLPDIADRTNSTVDRYQSSNINESQTFSVHAPIQPNL